MEGDNVVNDHVRHALFCSTLSAASSNWSATSASVAEVFDGNQQLCIFDGNLLQFTT